jgi:hypothetical protein
MSWLLINQLEFNLTALQPPHPQIENKSKLEQDETEEIGRHSPLTFESDRTLRESSWGIRGELVRLAVRETTGVGSYTFGS